MKNNEQPQHTKGELLGYVIGSDFYEAGSPSLSNEMKSKATPVAKYSERNMKAVNMHDELVVHLKNIVEQFSKVEKLYSKDLDIIHSCNQLLKQAEQNQETRSHKEGGILNKKVSFKELFTK